MNPDQPSPTVVSFGADVLDRMVSAVEKVRERLLRSTGALEAAGVPYAVAGGNAVAAWVSKVDPRAARNTVDVDLLVRRDDLPRITSALESAGFVYAKVFGVDLFLDGPQGNPRDAVHLLFAGEKVKADYREAAPDLSVLERHETFRIVTFESLVRMKLTSFRRKDQVHLLDMIEVGLLDATWTSKLPADLASRLQELFDNPD